MINSPVSNKPLVSKLPTMIVEEVDNPTALVLFAHGAGADKSSEFITQVTIMLKAKNMKVLCFNFPYMDKRLLDGKRRPPDRMPKLIECFEQVIAHAQQENLPIFLLGKSMGSRVAATLAANDMNNVKGVIALGYPFHPKNKSDSLRLTPLIESKLPIAIIQGSRDALGSQEDVINYNLPALCQVTFLADGDHDLKPRIKSGYTHRQHIERAINVIEAFINEYSHN